MIKSAILLYLCLGMFIACETVFADQELVISQGRAGINANADLAFEEESGNMLLVWSQATHDSTRIWAAWCRRTPDGAYKVKKPRLVSSATGCNNNPSVIWNPADKNYFIVWDTWKFSRENSSRILACTANRKGKPSAPQTLIDDGLVNTSPHLIAFSSGSSAINSAAFDLRLCWTKLRKSDPTTEVCGLFEQRLLPSGQLQAIRRIMPALLQYPYIRLPFLEDFHNGWYFVRRTTGTGSPVQDPGEQTGWTVVDQAEKAAHDDILSTVHTSYVLTSDLRVKHELIGFLYDSDIFQIGDKPAGHRYAVAYMSFTDVLKPRESEKIMRYLVFDQYGTTINDAVFAEGQVRTSWLTNRGSTVVRNKGKMTPAACLVTSPAGRWAEIDAMKDSCRLRGEPARFFRHDNTLEYLKCYRIILGSSRAGQKGYNVVTVWQKTIDEAGAEIRMRFSRVD